MYNPQLDTFIRVAEAGSFNKAAEELFISPPAVIKQINLLETSLGVTLFERTHRGLKLTPSGESMLRDTKYIIGYCRASMERARAAQQQPKSTIRVGVSPMTPAGFVPQIAPILSKKAPEIKFELVPFENTPENASEILHNLGQNIDIVAGFYDDASLRAWQCDALPFDDEPIRCAMSINHPLAQKEKLFPSDLYGQNFMIIRRGFNQYIDAFRDELWQEHPQINLVDFDFFSTRVFNECEHSGDVILTIDRWKDVHPMLITLPVEWEFTVPYGILHSPNPSPLVKRLLDVLGK